MTLKNIEEKRMIFFFLIKENIIKGSRFLKGENKRFNHFVGFEKKLKKIVDFEFYLLLGSLNLNS